MTQQSQVGLPRNGMAIQLFQGNVSVVTERDKTREHIKRERKE